MPLQYAPIYSALAEAGSAYSLPPAWSWLPIDSDCLQLPDASVAIERLAGRFPAEELVASGVAQRAGEELVISSKLTAQDPGFIVLRKPGGDPFNIATSLGCLAIVPPVLTMCDDEKTKEAIRGSDYKIMYGAFSMLDAVLLRSLGVAVAPATGLDVLTLPGLQRLLELVGGDAEGDIPMSRVRLTTDEEGGRQRHDRGGFGEQPGDFLLVLIAGNIAATTADIPEALTAAARHLAAAERHLGFNWAGISVWYPGQAELANILYRRQLGSARAVRSFFGKYVGNHRLQAFQQPGPPSFPNPTPGEVYFDLLKKLETRPHGPSSCMTDPVAERQRYNSFVDKNFVAPFVDKAMRTADPEDRALYMEMAGISRLYHRVMPAVFDSQSQSADAIWKNNSQFLPPELFEQLHSLGGQLLKLIREHKAIQKEKWGS